MNGANGDRSGHRLPPASVVVVSYNTAIHIGTCLRSLMELDYPKVEIIVVDNASSDGSAQLIKDRFPEVELVELQENRGFAGGASVGLYMASGEILATVNPDVRLEPQWMKAVAGSFVESDVGIVGSKILYPDGKTIQHAGGVVHYPLATTEHIGRGEPDHGQYDHTKQVSFVTGAAMAMRREVGESLSFFDEEYFPVYYEDVDLCWRAARDGMHTLYQPRAVAYHEETVTLDRRGSLYHTYYHANRLRFVVKRYTPEQVMLDFLPAEAARVAGDMPPNDRAATLALLDNRTAESTGPLPAGQKSVATRWDDLRKQLDDVLAGWQVYEKAHPAARKAKGPLGRLRHLANRWYTWPVWRKQIDYNSSLNRTLREVSRQLADLQARVAVASILEAGMQSAQRAGGEALTAEVESLRARVVQLESEVESYRANNGRARSY